MLRFRSMPFEEMTNEELYACMQMRQTVFVVEQECAYLDADGLDHKAFHVLGEDEKGELQAYARIFEKGEFYEDYVAIGRICTSTSVRGKGYGKDLVEFCLLRCEDLFEHVPIKVSAQKYLEVFYHDFGFRRIGEEYLEDGLPHIAMVKIG